MDPSLKTDISPLKLEEARRALATGTGKGIRIAVVDSGIEADHPQLKGLKLVHDLHVVDARDRFLQALAGVSEPQEKRRIPTATACCQKAASGTATARI